MRSKSRRLSAVRRLCGSSSAGWFRGRLDRGFTLFEVLVVLMIVGMVSALSMSMIAQVRSVLARIYPNAEHYARLEVRVGMLTRVIKSYVPSRTPDMAFKGDRTGFSGLATYFPAAAWPGEHPTRLGLVSANGQTTVVIDRLGAPAVAARMDVLQMTCEQAQFFYLDRDLQWRDIWLQGAAYPLLPLAIRLSCEGGAQPLHVIAAIEREGASIMADQPSMLMGR